MERNAGGELHEVGARVFQASLMSSDLLFAFWNWLFLGSSIISSLPTDSLAVTGEGQGKKTLLVLQWPGPQKSLGRTWR